MAGEGSKSGRTGSTGSTGEGAHARDRLVLVWEGGTTSIGLRPGVPVTVGRSRSADVRVDHASVSREHARFTFDEGRLTVTDLESRNGTWVDGQRLASGTATVLGAASVLRVGDVLVVHQPSARATAQNEVANAWKEIDRLLPLVARGSISVLVLGETGAGKEVTANALHRMSPRAAGPFVTIHCAALPESLLEAELFGWEKGAFTGATGSKVGLIESADGGTAFLDEITEISPSTQAKLLRVVETKSVTRLGSVRAKSVDVRFVAATNRDIHGLVARGAFRDDLYYRLAGIVLQVPSLRARLGDIERLAEKFVTEAARSLGRSAPTISREARSVLRGHAWPGNVRELRNAMECAVLLCQEDEIRTEHLPADIRTPTVGANTERRRRAQSLHEEIEELERSRILEALERTGGNQSRAARELGISRRLLLERLDAYGAPRPRKPAGGSSPRVGTKP